MASMPSTDRAGWSAPQWQAYVVQGADRTERARRLEEVPEHWQARVASHVQTAFAVRRIASRKVPA